MTSKRLRESGCLRVSITGIVQGVGFRPFVYKLAREMSLKGFVTNTADGVLIEVEGPNAEAFVERIRSEAPPLARIMDMAVSPVDSRGFWDFSIRESKDGGSFTHLSPDIALCDDCLRELYDEEDRRHLYPFINCTNCGPRYSITRSVPYDRPNTTMAVFSMCEDCLKEYHDPSNRRFHAQPNACPRCGPKLVLRIKDEPYSAADFSDPLGGTIALLREGRIVAIKGLGGFHLACDALNREAVERLRERKRRSNKPFALMAPDVETLRRYCHVSEAEEALLCSMRRPIVLLRKRQGGALSEAISPQNGAIGFMLPYTPLHYLLFRLPSGEGIGPHFHALVMTSGNLSEEPIIIGNDEAVGKLGGIADAFLLHDRDIFMRVDDSVVRTAAGGDGGAGISFVRRARGYTPEPVLLPVDGPDVLGCGGDLKNTFTLLRGRYAIISQHIGDMENYETLHFFEETLGNLKSVYRAEPEAIAHDLHPEYFSTRWALRQEGIKKLAIQHHYAHVGSVMASHGLRGPLIGVSLDGSGYGDDATIWGGEFFVCDLAGYRRVCRIKPVPLPGGDMASREPWRMAAVYLKEASGDSVERHLEQCGLFGRFGMDRIGKILAISGNPALSPLSSGAGRLFDAVASLIGLCDRNTFEGEAAMSLESLVTDGDVSTYDFDITGNEPLDIDFSGTILAISEEVRRAGDRRRIATRFHNTVAEAIISVVKRISSLTALREVALTGGVFQNAYLLGRVRDELFSKGFIVYLNESVPCNDAGISLGQAYIMRERMKAGLL